MPRVSVPSNPKAVTAMLMDMGGELVPKYINGKQQLPIPMRTVKTKWFEKTARGAFRLRYPEGCRGDSLLGDQGA